MTSTFDQPVWPHQLFWHIQQASWALGALAPTLRHLQQQPKMHPKFPGVTHPLWDVKVQSYPHSFATITHLLPSTHGPLPQ